MCRIYSRHFQICRIDEYWWIPYPKVSSRDHSPIYVKMPKNVDEYLVFAYPQLFAENWPMYGSTLREICVYSLEHMKIQVSQTSSVSLLNCSVSHDDGRCEEFWSASKIHVHSACRNLYTNPAQVLKYIARTEVSTNICVNIIFIVFRRALYRVRLLHHVYDHLSLYYTKDLSKKILHI